jgi:hypothetical protein
VEQKWKVSDELELCIKKSLNCKHLTPPGVKVDATGCEPDADKDGVPDARDKCPGTPAGVKVDASGCPKSVLGSGKTSWTLTTSILRRAKRTCPLPQHPGGFVR